MENACKKCRREGIKLAIKGERCLSPKCAFVKRSYAPGEQGKNTFSKVSEYGKQLREKQKAKRIYGLAEIQFARYARQANTMTGSKTENLVRLLETRLDNLVYRLGFASSRTHARQLVSHGLITVNGRKVTIPSYKLRIGDKISAKNTDKFKDVNLNSALSWTNLEKGLVATISHLPTREEIDTPINESLIIEYYSR